MILFTDIDGTLLNDKNKISKQNLQALQNLKDTIKVAITGRNLYSARRVLPKNLNIDYLVFSNGAGIIKWKTSELIYAKNLPSKITTKIVNLLQALKITFTLHAPMPDAHVFYYHKGAHIPSDFYPRLELYKDFAKPFVNSDANYASSIVCMLSTDEKDFFALKKALIPFDSEISITRSTSPINHRNIWLEIYSRNINKGNAAKFLCDYLKIPHSQTIAIGNDYNDLSLLEFVKYPFVVDNSPGILKQKFPVTVHHNESAVAEVIRLMLIK